MTHDDEQKIAAWQAKIAAPASERGTRTRKVAEPTSITTSNPTNPVYNAYWKFAAERQSVFYKRMRGEPGPWSQDHIIQEYKFTNAYRASDRASQFLIRNVIYDGQENQRGPEDTFFRVLLFKIFNLPETWEYLQGKTELTWTGDQAKLDTLDHLLTQAMEDGVKIFSGAYIQSSAGANGSYKHTAWLQILGKMMSDGLPARIAGCTSMEDAYWLLKSYEHLGPFLAYQYVTDLNYSPLTKFSESEFTVAGPGALRPCPLMPVCAAMATMDAPVVQ